MPVCELQRTAKAASVMLSHRWSWMPVRCGHCAARARIAAFVMALHPLRPMLSPEQPCAREMTAASVMAQADKSMTVMLGHASARTATPEDVTEQPSSGDEKNVVFGRMLAF